MCMTKVRSYKELLVWKSSMDFVVEIYKITANFPSSEKYGLTSQLRRSSVSIVSNIAEGSCRKNTKEFIYFLYISNGSLSEAETQMQIAQRLGYIENFDSVNSKIIYIRIMLYSLIRKLKENLKTQ